MNCTKGRPSAYTSYVPTVTPGTTQVVSCNYMLGKLLIKKLCVITSPSKVTVKAVTHYTCALNIAGGALTRVSTDTYAVSAAFSLSCSDGGGTASGSIESNDLRNAVLGITA